VYQVLPPDSGIGGHDDDGTRGAPAAAPVTAPPFAAQAPIVGVVLTSGAAGSPSDGSLAATPSPAPTISPAAQGPIAVRNHLTWEPPQRAAALRGHQHL